MTYMLDQDVETAAVESPLDHIGATASDETIDAPEGAETQIDVPAGRLEAPSDDNFHRRHFAEFIINGQPRRIELLHQLRPGDCILANFLNTLSIEEAIQFGVDSKLPMTVLEARQAAIRMRTETGQDPADILQPDSSLSYVDVVNLFSTLHGVPPKQEDILTIEGRSKTQAQLQLDALSILDRLDTYPSGVCTTGLSGHSRSIRKLQGDQYALIDPMDPDGIKVIGQFQLMDFLANHMAQQPANSNFFFFVRK